MTTAQPIPHHPRIRSRISNDITSMHRRMNTVLADLPSGWAEMNAWELRLLHNMAAMENAFMNASPHANVLPAAQSFSPARHKVAKAK